MTSKVQIFNQAVSLVGRTEQIQSPTEKSPAAQTCELWYDQARKLVLSAHHWSCATRVSRLALDQTRDFDAEWEDTDPPDPWAYTYSLPSDCLRPRHLSTFDSFIVTSMKSGKRVIATNKSKPILHYTFDETRPDVWEPDLFLAIATTLAAFIALGLTGQRSILQDMVQQAGAIITGAALQQANMDNAVYYTAPPNLVAHGGGLVQQPSDFVYPTAQLIVNGVSYAS